MEKPKEQLEPKNRELGPGLEQLTRQEQEVYHLLVPDYKAKAIELSEDAFPRYKDIQADLDHVQKMEDQFQENDRNNPELAKFVRRGELTEALIWNGIEENGWLGPEAEVIVASRYDDIVHGVDQIVEFIRELPTKGFDHLALSVDVTSSADAVTDKLAKIKKEITSGQLTTVKYFQSEKAHITGEMSHIPRVIVGIGAKTIHELCALELQRIRLQETVRTDKKELYVKTLGETKTKLANHFAQFIILREMSSQLGIFAGFARKNGQNDLAAELDLDCVRLNMIASKKIEEIAPDKKSENELESGIHEYCKNDPVYQTLQETLANDFER